MREYSTALAEESAQAREERHRIVAARRSGAVVMVRRGATAFAPENSLEACTAALDYGADGCAVDLRRTRDGAIVLFQDESLDRLTRGFGRLSQATFREVQSLPARREYGRDLGAIPPTFAALLDVARERGMLLDLRLREPGFDSDVARMLDQADAWDHVVHIRADAAPALATHPGFRPLRYKAPDLHLGRRDVDPDAVASALARPGQMILVDDPRVATRVLGRPPYRPRPFTRVLRVVAASPLPDAVPTDGEVLPLQLVRALAARPGSDTLAGLLSHLAGAEPGVPDGWRVVERAWAAQRVGDLGRRTAVAAASLVQLARQPTPHPDPALDGVDALAAVRALGELGVRGSVSTLTELADWQVGTASGTGASPLDSVAGGPEFPAALGVDARARLRRSALVALGGLRCGAARRFLRSYVGRGPTDPHTEGGPNYEAATLALLRQRLAWDDIAELLRSPNSAVRGAAILECLDHRTEERTLALRRAAPWALSLPRARH